MLQRRSSRAILTSTRWIMIVSGGLPYTLLLAIPNVFIYAMEWQISFALLFGSYAALGLVWGAMEKESATKYGIEAPGKAILRAVLLLFILVLVPVVTKIGTGVAEDMQRSITGQIGAARREPGFLSVFLLWPTFWAIICAYALKPVWDVAVEALRTKYISRRLDLGPKPRKANGSGR